MRPPASRTLRLTAHDALRSGAAPSGGVFMAGDSFMPFLPKLPALAARGVVVIDERRATKFMKPNYPPPALQAASS